MCSEHLARRTRLRPTRQNPHAKASRARQTETHPRYTEYSSRQVTSAEWCTLPQSARGVLEAQGSPDGACNPPNGCSTRTRRKAGANGAYAQGTAHAQSNMHRRTSPYTDAREDQMVHKPWSRGVCMGTRPLPGLGDASARRATHRMTAARARGARQVQTGRTHSAQYIATPREPARNAAPCNPPRPPSPHLGDIYLAYISPVHLAKGSNKRGSPGGTVPESTLSARAPRDFRNIAPRVSNPRLRKWWMRP